MRKLIDAEQVVTTLKKYIGTIDKRDIIQTIEDMPDAGCARNQRTTQYCAEASQVQRMYDEIKATHDKLKRATAQEGTE